ncbi:related to bifunctional 4-hydroxyphenylacetate degradation enzyme [Phialocephala subalpina]|uniref:Related to bifunctional 4-hydroxyphenylacetate degradation enzyme n=1 Tax=Phialocephala subalpina TaxID=576137 RepID=A0A1L7XNE3_9HELO|nr:related to bifunctional 4-hydroxyphenylacetate degradation enzyme [Phialocephala subalpina]
MHFERLIRFIDENGDRHFGEPLVSSPEELQERLNKGVLKARALQGLEGGRWLNFEAARPKDPEELLSVKQLIGPLDPEYIPIIRCIGLNYIKHIEEGGRKPPPYPSVFIKPSASTAGWNDDIPIPTLAQNAQLDYEGELAIVIGKDAKDITAENALEYIAGYTTANDISVRKWQRDPAFAGVVPQWCFSKGFDAFCPLGPMIVSPKLLGAADNLPLKTLVNGEVRQDSNTSDLLFGVRKIVSFCSQGTTLQRGSIILTGTPSGVAMGMAIPKWLQHGDVVEVSIGGIGSIKNRIVFQ